MHKEIRDAVEAAIVKAEKHFGETIPRPNIKFDLRGLCAGKSGFGKGIIRFNVPVAQENTEDFLKQTVPHEVAHWVQRWKYGYDKERVKSHGWQWRKIMIEVYRLSPKVTHRYKVQKVHAIGLWDYTCGCMDHQLSTVRHNRAKRGHVYLCKRCHRQLKRKGIENSKKGGLTSVDLF